MIEKTELLSTLDRFKTCADAVYDKKDDAAVKVTVSSTQPADGSHWIKTES